ncbi:MAG: tetratricopeptide repeat protein [Nitrospinota bacterium]
MTAENKSVSATEWVMQVRTSRANNDVKSALDVCRKGLESHPKSMDLLFTYGELRIIRYNSAKKPDHLKKALVSFEKLLRINPHHYMANLLAAQIYFKGRAYDRAEVKVNTILKNTPNDPRATQIKQAIRKAREKAVKKEDTVAKEYEPETDRIETEKLDGLQQVEVAEYETLINSLSHFNKLNGIISIHLVDHAGIAIKDVVKTGNLNDNTASLTADIFRSSGFFTRKIGLGNFQRGQIQTHGANLLLVNIFYGILVLVTEPTVDMGAVEERVDMYVADIV